MAKKTKYGERFRNVNSYIGAGCKFGNDVFIGNQSIVGDGTLIGSRTKIWHFVNITGFDRIGEDCMIASYVQLDPRVSIGDRTRIQPYSAIATDTKIGSDCFISAHVLFANAKYPNPPAKLVPSIIGDDVVIGGQVVIFPGIKINDSAIIGSNSIVTKDIPEFEEWRGNPAKFVRSRAKYDSMKELWGSP